MPNERTALTIAVGGGKGGVGKSVVAANLGVAMARLGMRTVIVDADLGAANQHTLFGVDRPGPGLFAVIDREVESLDEIAIASGEPRLSLVTSSSVRSGAANLPSAQKAKLVRRIAALDAEVVIIDVGAGSAWSAIDFFLASDLRVAVTTPQLTAIQNAYCFLKAAVHRELTGAAVSQAHRNAIQAAQTSAESARVADFVARAAAERAELGPRFAALLAGFGAALVGNFVEDGAPEARGHGAVHAVSRMVRDFLSIDAPVRATLALDRHVHASVSRRRPIAIASPEHSVSRALARLAEDLVTIDVAALRATRAAEHATPEIATVIADEARVDLRRYARRDERVRVSWSAVVRSGARHFAAEVRDASPHGLAIATDELAIGDAVQIEIRGVVLHGHVRNTRPGTAGVELLEVSSPVMRALLRGADTALVASGA